MSTPPQDEWIDELIALIALVAVAAAYYFAGA